MRRALYFFLCLLAGCARGQLDGPCNRDGTCNGPALECTYNAGGWHDHTCKPKRIAGPAADCHGEADCFCHGCARRCGADRIKLCAYSDTSVWGAKPATCECVAPSGSEAPRAPAAAPDLSTSEARP